MTVAEALRDATRLLRSHAVGVPELTARVFLCDALGRDQAWLAAHSDDAIGTAPRQEYEAMLRARCEGVPTQYVRGVQEFYGLEFRVNPEVLIPRPETEHLVEAALDRIRPGHRVADVGTGSGAVAVTLAKLAPEAAVAASDVSVAAVRVARENASLLRADVEFSVADLGTAFADASFDIVASNPPYVPLRDSTGLARELRHEPSVALYGGEDGLRILARLAAEAPRILRPGGWLLLEIGYDSRSAVERYLDRPEWTGPTFLPDLAGIDRVAAVQRSDRLCG